MLSSRYLQLMDKANQATDRQTYFFYIRQAEQLLNCQSSDNSCNDDSHSLAMPESFVQAA